VGQSSCSSSSESVLVSNVTKIAGSLEIEFSVERTPSHATLKEILRKGLANALNVSVNNVVRIVVSEIVTPQTLRTNGPRLLQSVLVVGYEVSYEVLPPASMDVDAIVSRANRITTEDTAEAHNFRTALTEESVVVEIRQIVPKIVARKFVDEIVNSPPQEEILEQTPPTAKQQESSDSVRLVLLVICPIILLILMACSAFCVWKMILKRNASNTQSKHASPNSGPSAADHSSEEPCRTPSGTLLGSFAAAAKVTKSSCGDKTTIEGVEGIAVMV